MSDWDCPQRNPTFLSVGGSQYLKIGTNPNARLDTEIWVINQLYNAVPVPKIYLDGETNSGNRFFLAEYFSSNQGSYPTELTEDKRIISYNLGYYLALIHKETRGVNFGILPPSKESRYEKWENFYKQWLLYNCEDAKKNFPKIASNIMSLIHWCDIDNAKYYVVNPIDFHSRNIYYDNKEINGIIDLERCFGGHPAWSYCTTREILSNGLSNKYMKYFENGYTEVREKPDISPEYEIAGILRNMRSAHMVWDDEESMRGVFQNKYEEIKEKLQ